MLLGKKLLLLRGAFVGLVGLVVTRVHDGHVLLSTPGVWWFCRQFSFSFAGGGARASLYSFWSLKFGFSLPAPQPVTAPPPPQCASNHPAARTHGHAPLPKILAFNNEARCPERTPPPEGCGFPAAWLPSASTGCKAASFCTAGLINACRANEVSGPTPPLRLLPPCLSCALPSAPSWLSS